LSHLGKTKKFKTEFEEQQRISISFAKSSLDNVDRRIPEIRRKTRSFPK